MVLANPMYIVLLLRRAGSEQPLPKLIKEKEPLWYRVPGTSSLHRTRKMPLNKESQWKSGRLGLKLAPAESW